MTITDRLLAPGVYLEAVQPPTAIRGRRTDVAGFVGLARRGPLHKPVRLTSWDDFRVHFGGEGSYGYLAHAANGFFANGGNACWVVRVADPEAARNAEVSLTDESGDESLQVWAIDQGCWGDELTVAVDRVGPGVCTLTVTGEGRRESWPNVRFDVEHPRFVERVLNDREVGSRLVRVSVLGPARLNPAQVRMRRGRRRLQAGADGLATLTPSHLDGDGAPPHEKWGLGVLGEVDEVALVAMPDAANGPSLPRLRPPPCPQPRPCDDLDVSALLPERPAPPAGSTQRPPQWDEQQQLRLLDALVAHCEEQRDRVALLDVPDSRTTPAQARAWAAALRSSFAACYFPWLKVTVPSAPGKLLDVPPCGHVAGAIARSDLAVGVHKPPANDALVGPRDLAYHVDDLEHAELNSAGVNVVRALVGRGIRVMGARTTSGDTSWRFLNVRRLVSFIAESLAEALDWVVFEPNAPSLWADVERLCRQFLNELWLAGMLDGATADAAYQVCCDEHTNPADEIEAGRIICLISLRPPLPAEVVTVRLAVQGSGVQLIGEPG